MITGDQIKENHSFLPPSASVELWSCGESFHATHVGQEISQGQSLAQLPQGRHFIWKEQSTQEMTGFPD